jgi:Rubredoxin-like zinc ribbon domain (DUF35_N)
VSAKPVPVPTPETQPFWDGCAAGELRIQRCVDCRQPYFYPRPVCPACGMFAILEAVRQVRGEAAAQVEAPDISVVLGNGGSFATAGVLVLGRQPR